MLDGLTTTIQLVSLAIAVWCLVSTLRDRPMVVPHLIGLGVLWLLLLGQGAVSVTLMVRGEHPAETAVFLGYLATLILLPPACAVWGFMERSRWGPAVIAFACLVLPVLMVRLEQTWNPALA